jgi:hypothetical protein
VEAGEIVEVFDADRFAGLFHFLAVGGQRAQKGAEFLAADAFEGVGPDGVIADGEITDGVGRELFGRADVDFEDGKAEPSTPANWPSRSRMAAAWLSQPSGCSRDLSVTRSTV